MRNYSGETIWIIGASSGIGAALAYELVANGATLIVSARSEGKLLQLCESLGPQHIALPIDVANIASVEAAFSALSGQQIDRMIFLAAAYRPMNLRKVDLNKASEVITVNILGTLAFLRYALNHCENQKKCQIALCGSVAGYVGLPNGQPYSATKAAIQSIAESLKAEAPPHIDVKLISPGFVKTPLTDQNDFDMPMIIEPELAAREIAKSLQKNFFEIHFPKKFTLIMKAIRLLPYFLLFRVTKRFK